MSDPLQCLRISSILIGFWTMFYCLVQIGVLGWQVKVVKDRQWEWENRMVPPNGFVDGFQARFPGLYALYEETPERRRINAMYAIVLTCLFLVIVHLVFSVFMTWGAYKRRSSLIFPWLFTEGGTIIMCTAYAVLWWSGDVFTEQLVMSVAEFVFSLAINGVLFIVVIFYVVRLNGGLASNKPKHKHHYRSEYRIAYEPPAGLPNERVEIVKVVEEVQKKSGKRRKSRSRDRSRDRRHRSHSHGRAQEPLDKVPPWRAEWNEGPPENLRRKLKRHENRNRRSFEKQRRQLMHDKGIDLAAPEVDDQEFPWKLPPPQPERRPRSTGSIIRELYYEDFPSERSFRRGRPPRGQRGRSWDQIQQEEILGSRPTTGMERVTFSRQDPQIYYRTPEETPSSQHQPAQQVDV
ncbi:unnamed protein product, partial [Mesorhabditis belari]|uniref:Uncharacterized protein n=1 Tax=Mesorhabditis belari TaxID=2138241 RepID=A0AAF3E8F3_9BILA